MLFMQHVGSRAYEEVRKASLPDEPFRKSMPFMAQVIREAFEPRGLVEGNRLQFSTLVQRDGQSASSFLNTLQVAAEGCDFGTAYSMVMSRLVAGVRDDRIRDALLSQAVDMDCNARKTLLFQLSAARAQSQALARAADVFQANRQRPVQQHRQVHTQ